MSSIFFKTAVIFPFPFFQKKHNTLFFNYLHTLLFTIFFLAIYLTIQSQECADENVEITFEEDNKDDEEEDDDAIEEVLEPLILNLQTGINLALNSQRKLGTAYGAILQSEINIGIAESEFALKFVPKGDIGCIGGGPAGVGFTVGGGVEVSKKFSHGSKFSMFPSMMRAAHDYQSNFKTVFTQPLLRGFGKEYGLSALRAAQFANRCAYRSFYLAQIKLIIQTIQTMYDIVKNKEIVQINRDSLARMQKFVTSTKMKEKIGMSDALDVYRATIELKHAEDALSQSIETLQDSKDSLRDILALNMEQPFDVDLPVEFYPAEVDEQQGITIAVCNRIEIDQANDQYKEMQRLERIAKKNLFPELNLVLDYTTYWRDEEFTRTWSNKGESKWGIGFTTSSDFQNMNDRAAYDRSLIATDDAARNIDEIRDMVILDVKRALRLLRRNREKIVLQEEQIQNSRKEFYLAQLKFEHGMANNFDIIQAEKNLHTAQKALISAVIDHKVGEYRLLSALGTLADKPGFCE